MERPWMRPILLAISATCAFRLDRVTSCHSGERRLATAKTSKIAAGLLTRRAALSRDPEHRPSPTRTKRYDSSRGGSHCQGRGAKNFRCGQDGVFWYRRAARC